MQKLNLEEVRRKRLENKTVLVTGASRGIGKACAIEFARRGYNLAITSYKNDKLLCEVKEQILEMGVKCYLLPNVDIGNYQACEEKIYNELNKEGIHIDILVNNAGISHIGLLQDMTFDEWNQIINTNLTSIFNTCKLFVPNMVNKQKGRIINVSSVWGNVGASCEVAYSATKGGINSFTKSLAKELAPSGIQVNAIAFGTIDTEMNNFLSEEDKNALCDEIPMGRFGQVEEAAKLLCDIAEGPKYLTGQIITMDGAWL